MRSIIGLLKEMKPLSTTVLAKTGTKVERFRGTQSFPLWTTEGCTQVIASEAKLVTLGPKNFAQIPNNSFYVQPDQFLMIRGFNRREKAIFCFKHGKLVTDGEKAGFRIRGYFGEQTNDHERLKEMLQNAQISEAKLWG